MADAVFKPTYPANGKAVTIHFKDLASHATTGRESDVIDNTSDRYDAIDLHIKVKSAAGTPGADGVLYVWAYRTILNVAGDAELYPTPITGGHTADNATITAEEDKLFYVGAVKMPAAATTYSKVFNLAPVFGGIMPRKWGIVIRNYSNMALSATEADCSAIYYGTNITAVTS